MDPKSRIVSLEDITAVCDGWRNEGATVVLTSGCFDLLHGGHLEYLCQAAGYGHLVAGVNSDDFVRRLKGDGRPIRDHHDRAFLIAGFAVVRAVCIFEDDYRLIEAVRPSIYIASETSHIRIWDDEERYSLLTRIGSRIVELGATKADSTTAIIARANGKG